MSDRPDDPFRRDDPIERTRRDVERRKQREPATRFWRAVGLIGSVGWPIVLLATGGALLGRAFDQRWHTGVRFTLMFLTMGTTLGTWLAFRTLRSDT